MFTGIIKDLGEVKSITKAGDTTFEIFTSFDAEDIEIGSNISCNGVSMTIVRHGISDGRSWFAITASDETMERTNLATWMKGTKINLEHALRMGDEMGGHIVAGHIDDMAEVVDIKASGDTVRFVFKAPQMLMKYMAIKGSLAVDGVSLTIDDVHDDTFTVNIIPHTQRVTTFSIINIGYRANIEIDILARYIARIFSKE